MIRNCKRTNRMAFRHKTPHSRMVTGSDHNPSDVDNHPAQVRRELHVSGVHMEHHGIANRRRRPREAHVRSVAEQAPLICVTELPDGVRNVHTNASHDDAHMYGKVTISGW